MSTYCHGDAAEGIKELDREKRYWILNRCRFRLSECVGVHTVQYTVRQQHGFDEFTFWQDFAGRVHTVVPFSSGVAVWFVSPKGTDFQNTHEGYDQTCAATGTALRSQGPLPLVPVSFGTVEVTCASTDMVDITAPEMAFLTEEFYRNEQE